MRPLLFSAHATFISIGAAVALAPAPPIASATTVVSSATTRSNEDFALTMTPLSQPGPADYRQGRPNQGSPSLSIGRSAQTLKSYFSQRARWPLDSKLK